MTACGSIVGWANDYASLVLTVQHSLGYIKILLPHTLYTCIYTWSTAKSFIVCVLGAFDLVKFAAVYDINPITVLYSAFINTQSTHTL